MGDPWTYQISVGLGPGPESSGAIPPAARCPACNGTMVSIEGTDGIGPARRWLPRHYWSCTRCQLEIPRSDGDPS